MDHERFGISDVREQAEELQRVNELLACVVAAANAEGDDRAGSVGKIFFRQRVVLAARQSGIVDPFDARMFFQHLGDGERIFRVALHAQVKSFNSLQNEKRVERREAGTGVAQALYSGFQDKGEIRECSGIGEAVIGRIGLDKVAKAAGLGPVKFATVDDDAGDAVAVSAEEFCGRMDDDIRAPLDGIAKDGRGNRVIDDERQAMFMRDGREFFQVDHIELGIAEGFGIDGASAIIDGFAQSVVVVGFDEADFDAELGQGVVEQIVGAAIERSGGDNLVAGIRRA